MTRLPAWLAEMAVGQPGRSKHRYDHEANHGGGGQCSGFGCKHDAAGTGLKHDAQRRIVDRHAVLLSGPGVMGLRRKEVSGTHRGGRRTASLRLLEPWQPVSSVWLYHRARCLPKPISIIPPAQLMIVHMARISDVWVKASAAIRVLLAAMRASSLPTLMPQLPARCTRRTASLPTLTAKCGDETMHLRFASVPPQ